MTRSLIGSARSLAGSRTVINRSQNYSMSFNGSSDYAFNFDFPVLYNRLKQVYTIEFWVKGGTSGSRLFGWNRSTGNALCALAGGGTGNAKLSAFYRNDSGTVQLNSIVSTTTILDSTWHHVVFSDNAGTVNVYIDKNLDATNFNYTVTGTYNSLNRTAVGALLGSSAANFFNGKMDQVRVYNIALNQTQVNAAYANSGYPSTNIMLDLGFNEGSGTVINNRGNFGSQWTLNSGTFSTDVPVGLEPISRSLV